MATLDLRAPLPCARSQIAEALTAGEGSRSQLTRLTKVASGTGTGAPCVIEAIVKPPYTRLKRVYIGSLTIEGLLGYMKTPKIWNMGVG